MSRTGRTGILRRAGLASSDGMGVDGGIEGWLCIECPLINFPSLDSADFEKFQECHSPGISSLLFQSASAFWYGGGQDTVPLLKARRAPLGRQMAGSGPEPGQPGRKPREKPKGPGTSIPPSPVSSTLSSRYLVFNEFPTSKSFGSPASFKSGGKCTRRASYRMRPLRTRPVAPHLEESIGESRGSVSQMEQAAEESAARKRGLARKRTWGGADWRDPCRQAREALPRWFRFRGKERRRLSIRMGGGFLVLDRGFDMFPQLVGRLDDGQ